jgi:hypothetical protein
LRELQNNSTIKVAKGVRETVNQDGAVLLDIEQGLCFSLNPVGARTWELVKDGRSLDEIADSLEKEFHLPRPQIFADVSDFLMQLKMMRLVDEQSSRVGEPGLFSRFLARH